jgi:hypothetical protein
VLLIGAFKLPGGVAREMKALDSNVRREPIFDFIFNVIAVDGCVASAISGRTGSAKMRAFELLRAVCGKSEVMSKREYRRFTAEQKIEILRAADQPRVTVSEVCRCHGPAQSVLYRWGRWA